MIQVRFTKTQLCNTRTNPTFTKLAKALTQKCPETAWSDNSKLSFPALTLLSILTLGA